MVATRAKLARVSSVSCSLRHRGITVRGSWSKPFATATAVSDPTLGASSRGPPLPGARNGGGCGNGGGGGGGGVDGGGCAGADSVAPAIRTEPPEFARSALATEPPEFGVGGVVTERHDPVSAEAARRPRGGAGTRRRRRTRGGEPPSSERGHRPTDTGERPRLRVLRRLGSLHTAAIWPSPSQL
ncbi:hypothetical protein BDA96_05G212600 [Sorghum bicolor]|uniref:Uncharacterized protein n=1 Tax=Sorghum bicolor TaxID=4558 RepID=A0A921UH67_SORBI|nr:hypothetical protein BDA96_05G212600 [Sorghum bicolor]